MSIKAQLKINGELKDVEIENGEITIIEPEKKATGWDFSTRPYYITAAGVTGGKWLNCDGMDKIYKTANAFSSEELTESINRMQTLQRQMFKWQAENDIIINLNSNKKWCILYNSEVNPNIHINVSISNYGFLPYFSSKEKAQECIEVFKDELEWLFKEFRWRMD